MREEKKIDQKVKTGSEGTKSKGKAPQPNQGGRGGSFWRRDGAKDK